MTDQNTSTSTVPDDDIGSSEDRHRDQPCRGPVASTIFLQDFEALTETGIFPAGKGACGTTVRHTVSVEPSSNRWPIRLSGSWACDTRLYHTDHQRMGAATAAKPSRNGQPPPSKRSPSAPRRTSGLMVRGTIFYLRIRVPQHLQARVGR